MTANPALPGRCETLAAATCRIRADLASQAPPAAVHDAVLAALRARPRPSTRAPSLPGSGRPAAAGGGAVPRRWGAAASVVTLIAGAVLWLLAPPPNPVRPTAAAHRFAPFMPVVPAEQWPAPTATTYSGAPAWLVAAELPRERLSQWGLPFDPTRAGEAVRAELLLRTSGEVLAVRVVHGSAER